MAIHKIDGYDGTDNFPKKFVTLLCNGAITAGQWVSVDISLTTNGLGGAVVLAPATANGATMVVGVATETTTATGNVKIQTAGKYENAYVLNAVAAGLLDLVVDTTAGSASAAAAGDLVSPCGCTLEAASGNLADVMIYDKNMF